MVTIDEIEKASTEIQNLLCQQYCVTTHEVATHSSCSIQAVNAAIEILVRRGIIKRISSQYCPQTGQADDVYAIVHLKKQNLETVAKLEPKISQVIPNSLKNHALSNSTTIELLILTPCPICGVKIRRDRLDRHRMRAHQRFHQKVVRKGSKKRQRQDLPQSKNTIYSQGRYYVRLKPTESVWSLGRPPISDKKVVDGY